MGLGLVLLLWWWLLWSIPSTILGLWGKDRAKDDGMMVQIGCGRAIVTALTTLTGVPVISPMTQRPIAREGWGNEINGKGLVLKVIKDWGGEEVGLEKGPWSQNGQNGIHRGQGELEGEEFADVIAGWAAAGCSQGKE